VKTKILLLFYTKLRIPKPKREKHTTKCKNPAIYVATTRPCDLDLSVWPWSLTRF